MKSLARLVVILGPTASGKSALGIWLAERLGGEVLACDSTQVYRHLEIGTGKVPLADQHGIPHHLLDLIEPTELFTAGEYRRRALEVLEDVKQRGRLPILTAGTGLYLRALLEGLPDAPARSEELRARLRERTERSGAAYLHRLLARIDPEAAARISARDTQKVTRAIEMRLLAGKTVGEIHRSGRSGLEEYKIYKIGLAPPRAQLYARIDARVETMIQAGWLGEVKAVLAQGTPATAKPFEFIGYSELRDHLEGRLSLEEAVNQIQQATRRYAKRQITWFRREPAVEWFAGFGDAPPIQQAVLASLARSSVG